MQGIRRCFCEMILAGFSGCSQMLMMGESP